MENKDWYKSRIILGGIVAVVFGIYDYTAGKFIEQCAIEGSFCYSLPQIPDFIYAILGALGIYARKTTTSTIK